MQRSGSAPLLVEDLASSILSSATLPSVNEQLDNLVLYLGKKLVEPGHKITLEPERLRAVLGSITGYAASWVIQQAIESGIVQGVLHRAGGAAPILNATLSISGWDHLQKLQIAASNSKRAFMAMKFGDEEMNMVFQNCFRPATERAGYNLMTLEDEPRAGLIDDRLRLDIRTSRFLIADLSNANKGAYWEAGYAEGLGRPVIYTCKQSVFDSQDPNVRPHFDTNHYLIVTWDENNLQAAQDKLTTTIRVTLPSEAKLTDN